MGQVDRRLFGQEGEGAAVAYLEREGYQVHDRNWSCRFGELDIVAEKDGYLCFVEVRMRSHAAWGDPAHTISFGKQRKVVKAALHYLMVHSRHDRMVRFDVVTVVGRGLEARVEHLPGAFDAGM